MVPTAQASVGEMSATPLRKLEEGTENAVYFVPSKCIKN
jgi:hypothetical protein